MVISLRQIFVGIGNLFLFCVWLGLMPFFPSKKGYLNRFLAVKCGYLFIQSIYAFLLRYIIWIVLGNSDAKENIMAQYFQKTNWYIWELMFFYLLFYLIYKFVPDRLRNILIVIVTVILATVLFCAGVIQRYYMSAFAFPAGLFFYEYFDSVRSFLNRGIEKLVVLVAVILGLSSSMFGMDSLVGMVYLRNLICLAVLGIMIYFLTYFHPGNNFLKFLGKYSTGIYIISLCFLEWMNCHRLIGLCAWGWFWYAHC